MANKFLVPVDFSGQSQIALEQSYNLARLSDAEIVLLYVIEEAGTIRHLLGRGTDAEAQKSAAQQQLRELADKVRPKAQVPIATHVSVGKIAEQVVATAKELKANLIIMATSGSAGVFNLSGTNAMRVIKHAPCPVITVRGKQHKNWCDTIVVPLDLTKETGQKAEMAIKMAKLFQGVTVALVSVLLNPDPSILQRLRAQMLEVRKKIENRGIPCTAELVRVIKGQDTIASGVLAYAKKIDADLIMVMTQQEREVRELFVGSAAQNVINKSEIPVMSVVPGKAGS